MDSIFSLLYIAIQNRLERIEVKLPPKNILVPAFRYIDADLGQLSPRADNRQALSWPCALIDIDKTTFTDMGSNMQGGLLTVVIRLGFEPHSASSSITPDEFRNKALFFYELEHAVQVSLHGWRPDRVHYGDHLDADISGNFGALTRTLATTQHRTDNIRVRELTYTVALHDYSTLPGISITTATPVVSAAFSFPTP